MDGVDSATLYVHAATYTPDSRQWSEVPQQDTVIGFGSQAVWSGERVVLPYGFDYTDGGRNPGGTPDPTGGYLDPKTGTGRGSRCRGRRLPVRLQLQALSDAFVTSGEGFVLDVERRTWHSPEPAVGAATEGARAAWLDRRLAVFGGSTTSAQGDGELSNELRLWELVEGS